MSSKRRKHATSTPVDGGLKALFDRPVVVEGISMSYREAYLRGLSSASIQGDIKSTIALDAIRRSCGAAQPQVGGYLVVPEPIPEEEWEKLCFEQQRPFRDGPFGEIGEEG